MRRGLETFAACDDGDFRRDVDDSESEVSEEGVGEEELALAMIKPE